MKPDRWQSDRRTKPPDLPTLRERSEVSVCFAVLRGPGGARAGRRARRLRASMSYSGFVTLSRGPTSELPPRRAADRSNPRRALRVEAGHAIWALTLEQSSVLSWCVFRFSLTTVPGGPSANGCSNLSAGRPFGVPKQMERDRLSGVSGLAVVVQAPHDPLHVGFLSHGNPGMGIGRWIGLATPAPSITASFAASTLKSAMVSAHACTTESGSSDLLPA